MVENSSFDINTVNAGKSTLSYNTKASTSTEKNILDIIPDLKDEYNNEEWSKEAICIINGKLTMRSKDKDTYTLAKSVGYDIFPYDVSDEGTLRSNDSNLALESEDGTLVIPDGITSIGEGTFSMENVKKVVLPSTCKTIEKNAFARNSYLEEVVFNDGLETIDTWAFAYCTNLKEVNLPSTLKSINDSAFRDCDKLTKVDLTNCTAVANYGFFNCDNLEEVTLPNVEDISVEIFSDCKNLKIVNIPSNIKKIDSLCLRRSDNIKTFNISSENKNIKFDSDNGFLLNNNDNSIIYICSYALQGDSFTIPNELESLKIDLSNYTNLKTLNIGTNLKSISSKYLPKTIENININSDNPNLIVYKNCVYSKDKKTMYMCFDKSGSIVFDEGMTKYGDYAFKCVANNTDLTFPNSLITAGTWSTEYQNIRNITFNGNNVNNLGIFTFGNYRMTGTLKINNSSMYYVEDNVIYESENKTKLIAVVEKKIGTFEVPSSVKEISDYAFVSQYKLTNVVLNEGLEKIGYAAFSWLGIKKIEIPSTVKEIESDAFGNGKIVNIIIHKKKDTISGSPWGCPIGERGINWTGSE